MTVDAPAVLWTLLTLLGLVVALVSWTATWFAGHSDRIADWTRKARGAVAGFAPVAALRRRYPRTLGFVAARLSPQEYLGLHLTIGLIVTGGALAGFAGVVEDIASGDDAAVLDDIVLRWLRAHVTSSDVALMQGISQAGAPLTVAILGAGVGLFLLWKRQRVLLAAWIAALAGAGALNWLLKALFRRARPDGADAFLHGASWSFPSGHAMGSLVVYGMLAYFLCIPVRAMRARIGIAGLALGIVLAIGFTRLYLGVHYFTDIIGGYCAGLVWLGICMSGAHMARLQQGGRD